MTYLMSPWIPMTALKHVGWLDVTYYPAFNTEKYGTNIGLFRDDGVVSIQQKATRDREDKKELCKILRDRDLKITVEVKVTKVDFLDVILDLKSGKHYPFTEGYTLSHCMFASNPITYQPQ